MSCMEVLFITNVKPHWPLLLAEMIQLHTPIVHHKTYIHTYTYTYTYIYYSCNKLDSRLSAATIYLAASRAIGVTSI